MRIKLDENMPARLVSRLSGFGHDVDTVSDEGLSGCDDEQVWAGAQAADRLQQAPEYSLGLPLARECPLCGR